MCTIIIAVKSTVWITRAMVNNAAVAMVGSSQNLNYNYIQLMFFTNRMSWLYSLVSSSLLNCDCYEIEPAPLAGLAFA